MCLYLWQKRKWRSCTTEVFLECQAQKRYSLWLNNSLHFGLRGIQEHHKMCWSDVTLNKTADRVEFLKYNERQTKTPSNANVSDVKPLAPKMFAPNSSEKDPVAVSKLFAQKRPEGMKEAQSPFYLAVNPVKARSSSSKLRFKGSKVGVKKLDGWWRKSKS